LSFRFSFPFGRPEGALKATLSLLERVLPKDIGTPVSRDDIRHFIGKCLENAAYTNYTRVSDQAKIEGKKKAQGKDKTTQVDRLRIYRYNSDGISMVE
jgi:hypothetical protein